MKLQLLSAYGLQCSHFHWAKIARLIGFIKQEN
jgi:hypothetical protein